MPPVTLDAFEGPLDLLLHLIREHKVEITDIPIAQITDQYLAYLGTMEALNLTVAGEFLVMAATLLEMKSRTLLPKPPEELALEEEGVDPRSELVQRLLDYQRYKLFVTTLQEWEDDRRRLFFRPGTDVDALYPAPIAFGALSARSLAAALERLLSEAGAGDGEVTTVHRQKMTVRLAMASLSRKLARAGEVGVSLDECMERPLVRLQVVMTFLALLELLRQGRVSARQTEALGEIWLRVVEIGEDSGLPLAAI